MQTFHHEPQDYARVEAEQLLVTPEEMADIAETLRRHGRPAPRKTLTVREARLLRDCLLHRRRAS